MLSNSSLECQLEVKRLCKKFGFTAGMLKSSLSKEPNKGNRLMHDFGKIVYLEMQKTGSTFVNSFLRECCLLEEISYKKHGVVRDDYASDKFYFITIRHPYDLYSSLYRYGLDGQGAFTKA